MSSVWHLLLFSLPFVSLDEVPPPIPIIPSRDAVPRREPPVPATSSPASAWAIWPQIPQFGQSWPNSLLGFPSLFPAPISTESLSPNQQREEEKPKHDEESQIQPETGNASAITGSEQFVGIRARFNPPTFEEIARLFYSVFNHEAQHIQIRPQKQCFAEGCFRLHTFRIVGFQRPRAITLKPLGPNLLLLNILSFDVDIESLLNGNIQLLLTAVPVTGNFQANTRQLSITALFDLQKDQNKVPYLRMSSCELRSGSVSTKVSNIGLLTDSINLKYKTEMLEKARELITSTICETISDTIRERVNRVLRRLPRAISVATILGGLVPDPGDCPGAAAASVNRLAPLSFQLDSPQHLYSNQLTLAYGWEQPRGISTGSNGRFWRRRQRRGMDVIRTEAEERGKASVAEITGETNKIVEKKVETVKPESSREVRLRVSSNKKKANSSSCSAQGYTALLDFIDLQSLGQVFIELDFLDSSAGQDFFAVGISGDVFLRVPHQVSYVSGGVREVLAGAALWERLTNKSGGSADEEDKSLLLGDEPEPPEHRQLLSDDANERPFPPQLRFPGLSGPLAFRKSLEIIFSDLSANLVLLQAYRAKLLKVRIGPQSALFGPMLKTSCGSDAVCLGDSVPEAGEKYPDQQLELEVEPVQPPRVKFSKDLATLSLIGAATFFLAKTKQPIARIPFTAIVELSIRTVVPEQRSLKDANGTAVRIEWQGPSLLEVGLAIPKLEILEDVDFFELPASMLDGFRDAAQGAILNSAAKVLASGVPLDALERKLCPWGIVQPGIQLLRDGLVLLSADLDAYTLLFEDATDGQQIDAVLNGGRPICAR